MELSMVFARCSSISLMGLKANLYKRASRIKKFTADHPITYQLPNGGGFPPGAGTGTFAASDAKQKVANPITIMKDKRRTDK
jgi:hypothetical protein